MQEFVYFNETPLDFPLHENIFISQEPVSDSAFIVSNSSQYPAEIIANEINFYIQNTKDSLAKQIENIHKLYQINGVKFDKGEDIKRSLSISNQVLFICNEEQKKLVNDTLSPSEFDELIVSEDRIKDITGNIGNLTVTVKERFKESIVQVSQIVWFGAKELGMKQSGCFDPLQSSLEEVLDTLRKNISDFSYKNNISYNATICQYHERRDEICGRCVDECPTTAIIKDNATKHLLFNPLNCIDCGGCVSVCPSGSLDYTPSNTQSIAEIAKLLQGHHPLIIPRRMNTDTLELELKANVLPLAIDAESFLQESTLLALLQESGSQLVFYSDFISKGTTDAIYILNQIYQLKYSKDAVFVATNKEELEQALEDVDFIEDSNYTFHNHDVRKREAFALRLKHIVGNEDLGEVQCGEYIHYGVVKVKEDNCTLCLACVSACNVGALIADAETNSLLLNSSICTTCGYCESTCPEKDCISIERDVIKLNPTWFTNNVVAQDELFACVECHKEFATKKMITKIANMMAPLFKSDPIKERTLYCCEDCKPKIMMKSYMENKKNYNNTTIK